MGLFGSAFCLMIGGGAGVYAAQNYDVPNVKKLANDVMVKADNYMEKHFPKLPTETPGATTGGSAAAKEE